MTCDSVNISGSGRVSGGTYQRVRISGSGRISGNIVAEDVSVSGSASFHGNVKAGDIRVSGSGSIDGDVAGDAFQTSGSCKIHGQLAVRQITVGGSCAVEQGVETERLHVRGSMRVARDVMAENFDTSGAFRIGGSVYSKRIRIQLSSYSEARDVVCEDFDCRLSQFSKIGVVRFFWKIGSALFGARRPLQFKAQSIQANAVHIEYGDVDSIQGRDVYIGPNCTVEKVTYSGTLQIDPTSTVRHKVKTES